MCAGLHGIITLYPSYVHEQASSACSAVPARLGLKAPALAWPEAASAFSNPRPGQSREPRLGSGLARPRPRLLYVKCTIFRYRSVGVQESYSEQYIDSSSSSSISSPSHENSSISDSSSEPAKSLPVLAFSCSSLVSSPSDIEDGAGQAQH
jgi:hypothetical protein